jgi:ketopantoate reductase
VKEGQTGIVAIVGPGAVGQMLAFYLQRIPYLGIQLIGRKGLVRLDTTVRCREQDQRLRLDVIPGTPHLLFLCVKSYDLNAALETHLPVLPASCPIVCLGNGYLEPLLAPWRERFPGRIWRKGIVTRGVRWDDQQRLTVSALGEVVWGADSSPTFLEQRITHHLAADGLRWSAASCELRREKWFFNTVLNTIAGAYRLPSNGDAVRLFAHDLERLAQEVFALSREIWPDWRPSWTVLWTKLEQLIKTTASNENSMARDVRIGRKTEADVLSGLVLRTKNPQAYPLLLELHRKLPS